MGNYVKYEISNDDILLSNEECVKIGDDDSYPIIKWLFIHGYYISKDLSFDKFKDEVLLYMEMRDMDGYVDIHLSSEDYSGIVTYRVSRKRGFKFIGIKNDEYETSLDNLRAYLTNLTPYGYIPREYKCGDIIVELEVNNNKSFVVIYHHNSEIIRMDYFNVFDTYSKRNIIDIIVGVCDDLLN